MLLFIRDKSKPSRFDVGLSRAPAPTHLCLQFVCRKIASLFADFTLYMDIEKAVQRFVLRHRFVFGLQFCTSSFIILHRLVGLRLLRLCLKLRQGFALYPQGVSPLDPDQGRAPGPFARFARCFILLYTCNLLGWPCQFLTPHFDRFSSLSLSQTPLTALLTQANLSAMTAIFPLTHMVLPTRTQALL